MRRTLLVALLVGCGGPPPGSLPSTGYLVYVRDREGSVLAAVDDQGQTLSLSTNDGFGLLLSSTGTPVPRAFLDQDLDEETGYLHFRDRYYDPSTAQWISPDPNLLAHPDCSGRVQECNPYTFAGNRPLEWTDTNGREALNFIDAQGIPNVVYTLGFYGPGAAAARDKFLQSVANLQGSIRVTAYTTVYEHESDVPSGETPVDCTGASVRLDGKSGSWYSPADGQIHLGKTVLETGNELGQGNEMQHEAYHAAGHPDGYETKLVDGKSVDVSLQDSKGGIMGNFYDDNSTGFSAGEKDHHLQIDLTLNPNGGSASNDPSFLSDPSFKMAAGGAGQPAMVSTTPPGQ